MAGSGFTKSFSDSCEELRKILVERIYTGLQKADNNTFSKAELYAFTQSQVTPKVTNVVTSSSSSSGGKVVKAVPAEKQCRFILTTKKVQCSKPKRIGFETCSAHKERELEVQAMLRTSTNNTPSSSPAVQQWIVCPVKPDALMHSVYKIVIQEINGEHQCLGAYSTIKQAIVGLDSGQLEIVSGWGIAIKQV